MGRSFTPKYRIESMEWAPGVGGYTGSYAWDGKRHGAPSIEAASKWREAMNKSFEAGGTNAHLAGTRIGSVKLVRQSDAKLMAEYTPPMFQVV